MKEPTYADLKTVVTKFESEIGSIRERLDGMTTDRTAEGAALQTRDTQSHPQRQS